MLAEYGDDFYKGMPVLTRNRFGQGEAWYVASSPEPAFLRGLPRRTLRGEGIAPLPGKVPGVEVTRRELDGKSYLFVLNHNEQEADYSDLGDAGRYRSDHRRGRLRRGDACRP